MPHIADHVLITSRYFFPRPESFAASADTPSAGMRVQVPVAGAVLDCYLRAPHPNGLTLVLFHGNGEVVADYVGSEIESWILTAGANLFLAEYRGYGGSSGQPALAAMLDDVAAIVAAIGAAIGTPPSRLVFMGRSLGSIYAIHGASQCTEAAGLIIESGIADVSERILVRVTPDELGVSEDELRMALAERFDHKRKLAAWRGPSLILHARDDELLSLSHAERNHQWAAGPKQLVVFERGGHNGIMFVNLAAYARTLAGFLRDSGEKQARG